MVLYDFSYIMPRHIIGSCWKASTEHSVCREMSRFLNTSSDTSGYRISRSSPACKNRLKLLYTLTYTYQASYDIKTDKKGFASGKTNQSNPGQARNKRSSRGKFFPDPANKSVERIR